MEKVLEYGAIIENIPEQDTSPVTICFIISPNGTKTLVCSVERVQGRPF